MKTRSKKPETRKKGSSFRFSFSASYISFPIVFFLFWFLVSHLWFSQAADNPTPPTFTLTLFDGATASGPLEQIDDHWSVRLGGAKPVQASGMQVIAMRQDKVPFPSLPKSEQVIFANGDRLPGSIRELTGDRLRMNAKVGKEADFTVPLSSVSIIWVTAPDGVDHPDRWRRRMILERRSRDRVYLRNGDIIEGIVNSIT